MTQNFHFAYANKVYKCIKMSKALSYPYKQLLVALGSSWHMHFSILIDLDLLCFQGQVFFFKKIPPPSSLRRQISSNYRGHFNSI